MASAPSEPGKTDQPNYRRIAERLRFPTDKERVAVIFLDGRRVKLTRFVPSLGDVGTARFDVGAIIRQAKQLKASGIVLVHNHPSGELRASPEDLRATLELAAAATKAGVKLVDHLVYAGGKVRSPLG